MMVAVLGACGSARAASGTGSAKKDGPLTKVVVATGFEPDVEFAPYYVAQSLGYYRAVGLDVQMNYARDPDLLEDVGNGRYAFAVTSGDTAAVAAAAGVPIRYVMAQYQRYPIGAITLKKGGLVLTSPRQLKGLKVGISMPGSSTAFGLSALLKAGGLSPRDVTTVSIGFTEVEALVSHRVQVAMTYLDNEPVEAAALGHPVNVLPVSRYLNLTSNGVVTSSSMMANHRREVEGFVAASLRGLSYTLAHPDAAFRICRKYMPALAQPTEAKIERQVLTARLAFQQPPTGHPLGWSNPKEWTATVDFLRSIGAVRTHLAPTRLFSNSIVDRVDVHAQG